MKAGVIVPQGWTGDLTPSGTGYTFTPALRSYTSLATSQTTQDFAAATDWQAEYDVDGGGFFRLMLTHAGPDVALCDDCLRTEVPGGRIGVDSSQSLADMDADHPWVFRVMFQGDDGRIAIATEKVAGATLKSARQARTFTDAQLAELVQDPTLTFPDPD